MAGWCSLVAPGGSNFWAVMLFGTGIIVTSMGLLYYL